MSDPLAIGTKVRIRPSRCDSLGIDWTIRGGEGMVVGTMGDAYIVQLDRDGRTRTVRRDNVVVHRPKDGNQPGNRARRARSEEDSMGRKKKEVQAAGAAPDMALAKAEAEPIIKQVTATAEYIEKVEPLSTAAQVRWAINCTAEIKREAKRVEAVIEKFVGPSKAIIEAAKEVFGPALVGLEMAEDKLKGRILEFVERSEPERLRLLKEAGEARADQSKAAALIATADQWAVPDVPGFAVVERPKVEVKDTAAFVAWAIENKREDLLVPNTKALVDLYEAGDMGLPGVTKGKARHVQITESKVVAP